MRPASASASGTAASLSAAAATATQRLGERLQGLHEQLNQGRTQLQFQVDQELHVLIVTVIRAQDGEVLRQFPSDERLRIARLLANEAEAQIGVTA